MKDGEHIEYFDSGDIWCKCNYLGGELHGEHIDYYSGGDIKCKCNYKDGKYHGECIYYYPGGEIFYKSCYIDGKGVIELEWISYNRNIKLELILL